MYQKYTRLRSLFAGTYMEHCHNTTHEDTAMLVRWDSEKPGQTQMMPAPTPSWYGENFVDTVAETTVRNGNADFMKSSYVSLDGVIAPGQVMAVKGTGANCSFTATRKDDGNFTVARGGTTIWQTNTGKVLANGKANPNAAPGRQMRFLANGRLAVFKTDNTIAWQSGPAGTTAFQLVLDGNGRFSMKNKNGTPVWNGSLPVPGCH
jgi:hypothetical protein